MQSNNNQTRKRVLCLVGTRPECIKMAPVIIELKKQDWSSAIVVSTGQHRELIHQTLGIFDIKIDYDLEVMQPNQTLASLSSQIFSNLDLLLEREHFDLILVQGDTTSVMVASLAAFYRQIPIGHLEAGLRTHNIQYPFPEELNRCVTSLVADIHFAPTQLAYDNLISENHKAKNVHITGNTVIDALHTIASKDLMCSFPTREDRKVVLITAHRRENFGQPILDICAAIKKLRDRNPELEFVYPVHPNPNIKGPVHTNLNSLTRVHLLPAADYESLISLMKSATVILTDSGGIQEEAPALGKPVLILRNETERPEAVNAGVAKLVGTQHDDIIKNVEELISNKAYYDQMAKGGSPYGDGKAAARIVDLCKSLLT